MLTTTSCVQRSAPKAGYDFGAKRDYRRKVWGQLLTKDDRQGFIGLMPSNEGDEVEYLLRKGVSADRMVFIDRNPAIAAVLSRRFRPARSYGCDVIDAILRMQKSGISLTALNLDLCGPVSPKLEHILETLARTQLICDNGMVAVTVMKGRERGRSWDYTRQYIGSTMWQSLPGCLPTARETVTGTTARIAAVFGMLTRLGVFAGPLFLHRYYQGMITAFGEYPSGHLRMLWTTIQLHRQPCDCLECTSEWIYSNGGNFATLSQEQFLWFWQRRVDLMARVFGEKAVRDATTGTR